MADITISRLVRYPIKGLSGQDLSSVPLQAGLALPQDRRYGIAHATSLMDVHSPEWTSKKSFLNLARDEKLGELSSSYDDAADKVTLLRKGKKVVSGNLTTPEGRMVLEGMLNSFMPAGARGHGRIVDGGNDGATCFTDQEENYISLINLATITDIERVVRAPLDPRRFRGNLYITGASAWQEHDWVGKTLRIGGVVAKVVMRIERCNAVNVAPETGKVEVNVPLALRRGFRHADCGVFLSVISAGDISANDRLEVLNDG